MVNKITLNKIVELLKARTLDNQITWFVCSGGFECKFAGDFYHVTSDFLFVNSLNISGWRNTENEALYNFLCEIVVGAGCVKKLDNPKRDMVGIKVTIGDVEYTLK